MQAARPFVTALAQGFPSIDRGVTVKPVERFRGADALSGETAAELIAGFGINPARHISYSF
jgi:hypothetical protein